MTHLQEKRIHKDTYGLYYYTQGDPSNEAIVFIIGENHLNKTDEVGFVAKGTEHLGCSL